MRNIVYQDKISLGRAANDEHPSIPLIIYANIRVIPRLRYKPTAFSAYGTMTVWIIGEHVHISGSWFRKPVVVSLNYVKKMLAAPIIGTNLGEHNNLAGTVNRFLEDTA